jgi:hypothetical protein
VAVEEHLLQEKQEEHLQVEFNMEEMEEMVVQIVFQVVQ